MSMTFTKLFSSITESTIWREPDHVRLVWITMLAMADKRGRIWASIPGLADRARVPIKSAEKALQCFLSPDTYSRTKENEGRRVEEIDGGWRLLNHKKYRDIRDEEVRREQNAAAQARFRSKQSKPQSSEVITNKANAEAAPYPETEEEGTWIPPFSGRRTTSELIALENSLKRVVARQKEIKEADMPGFREERATLKDEKARLLKLLGLKV